MKRILLFLSACIALCSVSCTGRNEAKKRLDRLPSYGECAQDLNLTHEALKEVDEIIQLEPRWWEPYRRKMSLYYCAAYTDYDIDAEREAARVYEEWAKINEMDIRKIVAYATHLEKSGESEKALEVFRQAWTDFSKMKKRKPKNWREEELMFAGVYAGVRIGMVTSDSISEYHYIAGRNPEVVMSGLEDMVNPDSTAVFFWD